jgi:hypothetical protein
MRRKQVTLGFIAIAGIIGLYALATMDRSTTNQRAARTIVQTCQQEANRAACYERLVPALYPDKSVREIFDIVRIVRRDDAAYQFCHVLAHKVGERLVAEDPNAWVDVIPYNPSDGLCSNGYIHGVIGGRFRAEVLSDDMLEKLLPDFRRACEAHNGWEPSDLDRAMCYHGMGHLYDFITNAQLDKALSLCERTTSEQFRRVCREGVFMQIYQPLEPDDFELIEQMPVKPTPATVRQFCARYRSNPSYEGACLRESWPMHEGMTDGSGVTSFCSGQPNAAEEMACYESASAIIGRMTLGDSSKAVSACSKLEEQWQGVCFATTAQAILEENRTDASKSIELCAMAPTSVSRSCMMTLMNRASFIFGDNTGELRNFCAALPADMRALCEKGLHLE